MLCLKLFLIAFRSLIRSRTVLRLGNKCRIEAVVGPQQRESPEATKAFTPTRVLSCFFWDAHWRLGRNLLTPPDCPNNENHGWYFLNYEKEGAFDQLPLFPATWVTWPGDGVQSLNVGTYD